MTADLTHFWFAEWSQPIRRPSSPNPAAVPFATGDAAREDTPIMARWFSPWLDPVRRPRSVSPYALPFTGDNPYGMTLPEAVHVQWYVPWQPPVLRKPFPPAVTPFAAFGRPPASVAGLTFFPAVGAFGFSGAAVAFPGSPADLPAFYWDQSYVIPLNTPVPGGQLYDPEFEFIAYDPYNLVLWVQWSNGLARTYKPVPVGTVRAIAQSDDPADIIAGLPVTVN